MSQLDQAQSEWLELFSRLQLKLQDADLAAPFLSVPPARYDPVTVPSILYVGKATGGDWYRKEFLRSSTVGERRARTTKFLDEEVKTGGHPSAFWHFALNLSARVAKINSNAIEPLQNIVWTNISKIGVCLGNPRKSCLIAQRELSTRTLKLEIVEYCPSLIVFVTHTYEPDIIGEITGDHSFATWDKGRDDGWFWSRRSMDGIPPIFLAGHPQGKTSEEIERWLEKASVLATH